MTTSKPKRKTPRGAQINRCPDCNKFVPLELEVEEEAVDVEAKSDIGNDGVQGTVISGTIRAILKCGECGTELAEASLDVEIEDSITHNIAVGGDVGEGEHDLSLSSDVTESDTTKGKGRFAPHLYGYSLTGTVSCECGAETPVESTEYEQASGFESLN